jgi:hypothetical protein
MLAGYVNVGQRKSAVKIYVKTDAVRYFRRRYPVNENPCILKV